MLDPVKVGSALTVVAVTVLTGVIKSWRSGYLRKVWDQYVKTGERMNGKLDEVLERQDETLQETRKNGEHIDDLAETVVLLHRDDEHVDVDELRERVNVEELDGDIFRDRDSEASSD